MIRILDSSLDRTVSASTAYVTICRPWNHELISSSDLCLKMIHSCQNSAKRGKSSSGVQKVIRCTLKNRSTGYLEHFIVNTKTMKGCWIPAHQLDLSSLMMELSHRRHVQVKQRQERLYVKEKADKEKAELIKIQRATEAAKKAEEARQRRAVEAAKAEEARQRRATEAAKKAEHARQRKATEAAIKAEEKRRRKSEAATKAEEARQRKAVAAENKEEAARQRITERTTTMLALQQQKSETEIARLHNHLALALAQHERDMLKLLKTCVSSGGSIPGADVDAIRKHTLETLNAVGIGLQGVRGSKLDHQQVLSLMFIRERCAVASIDKSEHNAPTKVKSHREHLETIAVAPRHGSDLFPSQRESILQVGNQIQIQPRHILSSHPPAQQGILPASSKSCRTNAPGSGSAPVATETLSHHVLSPNETVEKRPGGCPDPSRSCTSYSPIKLPMTTEQQTTSCPQEFHNHWADYGGNFHEGASVTSTRGLNGANDQYQTREQTISANGLGGHPSSFPGYGMRDNQITGATYGATRAGITNRSQAKHTPPENEWKPDLIAFRQRQLEDRLGSGVYGLEDTDSAHTNSTSTAFTMDLEPKPLRDFSPTQSKMTGESASGRSLSGFRTMNRQQIGNNSLKASQNGLPFHQLRQMQVKPSLTPQEQQYHFGQQHYLHAVQSGFHQEELSLSSSRKSHQQVAFSQFGGHSTGGSQNLQCSGTGSLNTPPHQHRELRLSHPYAQGHQHQQHQFFVHQSRQQQQHAEEEPRHTQAQRYRTPPELRGERDAMRQSQHGYEQQPMQHQINPSHGHHYSQLRQLSTTQLHERYDPQIQGEHSGNQDLHRIQQQTGLLELLQQPFDSPASFYSAEGSRKF
jgi:hypothetical protein